VIRPLAVLAVSGLLAACSGGGAVDSTGGPSTSPSPDELAWLQVVVDSEGVTGQQPSLVVNDAGRVAVVYQRELMSDEYDVVFSSCDGPVCETLTHSTLVSGQYWPTDVGVSSGGVLISGYGIFGEGTPMVMWWCPDWGCGSHTQTETEHSFAALNTDGADLPLIAYGDWSGGAEYEMMIGFCDDSACSTHRSVSVFSGQVGWHGPAGLGRLPNGSPVMFFRPAADPEQGTWNVIACGDPECSTTTVHQPADSWAETPAGDPNLPWVVYAKGKEVHLLSCGNGTCSEISDVLLLTVDEAELDLKAKATYASNELFVLVQHAHQYKEDLTPDYKLELFRCSDGQPCSQEPDLPFSKGNWFDIAAIHDDGLAVAVQSGRLWLCIDECADPNDELAQLALYITNLADHPRP
jgi:hypothetical protein